MTELNKAQAAFKEVQRKYPMYQAQADWTPAIFDSLEKIDELKEWLDSQGYKRGDKNARNDYLAPITGLIIFKDSKLAVEAKLRFG